MPLSFDVLQTSLEDLWLTLISYLPSLVGAIIVFLIGVVVAIILRSVITKISDLLHLDDLATKLDIKSSFLKYGIKFSVKGVLGWLVKWFVIVVFLIAATDILGWAEITDYLKQVVLYLPNVVIAVVILIVGILLANFVRNVVKTAVAAAKLESADVIAGLAKWAILIFTIMAALIQLQIAETLIQTLFTGLVAMLALAGGLAFGLGGKEHATKVLNTLKKDISSKRD